MVIAVPRPRSRPARARPATGPGARRDLDLPPRRRRGRAGGRAAGGLVAAVLPRWASTTSSPSRCYTLRVIDREDAVALVVPRGRGACGWLVARALGTRRRAERSEREARLLGYLSTRLLSGEPLDRVLDDFVGALLGPLHLRRCELGRRRGDRRGTTASSRRGSRRAGGTVEAAPRAGRRSFGTLVGVASGRASHQRRRTGAPGCGRAPGGGRPRAGPARRAGARGPAGCRDEPGARRAVLRVTHDLRTPLASIKAGVTSLLDSRRHPRRRAASASCSRRCSRRPTA